MTNSRDITALLGAWRAGDSGAGDALMRVVYEQLHTIAARHLKSERNGITIQPTDLVHEAYLRLAGADVDWQNRGHFFAVSARIMRRILVDYARAHLSERRGGALERIPLGDWDGAITLDDNSLLRMLALDDALTSLAQFDLRKSQIVEMTFFGGLSREETAAVVDVSLATLHREMKLARAWLHARLTGTSGVRAGAGNVAEGFA